MIVGCVTKDSETSGPTTQMICVHAEFIGALNPGILNFSKRLVMQEPKNNFEQSEVAQPAHSATDHITTQQQSFCSSLIHGG